MSIVYCAIPHFVAALARRDHPELQACPLVLVGPEGRVLAASAEAAARGVFAGVTVHTARVRCPDARLVEADVAHCRREFETLLELLEHTSPRVEPHGWNAAYVDLGDRSPDRASAVPLCQEIGRSVRRELGETLQPALGWDSAKFTAQAAARRTRPGHLLAVPPAREREFLTPLPVSLLPLEEDVLRRLGFLGLRTLGQYAALPPAAVWQQFGRAGKRAQCYARGEDDRPVVPRWQAHTLTASYDLEDLLVERVRLLAHAQRLVGPLLAELRANLQACGQVRLAVHFDDGSIQERTRSFLFPTAEEPSVARAMEGLIDQIHWPAAATALAVDLGQIQDAVLEQLTLFPAENERERKLREVQRYLTARFGDRPGAPRLRRAILAQPDAPIPEWRAGWVDEDEL
jgi:DNA polymerase-4